MVITVLIMLMGVLEKIEKLKAIRIVSVIGLLFFLVLDFLNIPYLVNFEEWDGLEVFGF
jgi:hypothetical protein